MTTLHGDVPGGRAVMQPIIPGSGPWRFYFADYDVDESKPRG